jgi:hypothetical protein
LANKQVKELSIEFELMKPKCSEVKFASKSIRGQVFKFCLNLNTVTARALDSMLLQQRDIPENDGIAYYYVPPIGYDIGWIPFFGGNYLLFYKLMLIFEF